MARSSPGVGAAPVNSLNPWCDRYFLAMTGDNAGGRVQRSSRKVWIATAAVVLVVYALANLAFAQAGRTNLESGPGEVSSGVNFGIGMTALNSTEGEMTLRIVGVPVGAFVDESSGTWAKSIRVTMPFVTSGSATRTVPAGTPVGGTQSFSFLIDGDSLFYPFDQYQYGFGDEDDSDPETAAITQPAPLLIVQEVDAAGAPTSLKVDIGMYPPEGLQGWSEQWVATAEDNTLSVLLTVKRSGGVLAFVLVVLTLMIGVALLASLVARAVVLKRRPIEATMAGWFAALLFALIPLRTNLPDSPPIGAWIDVAVFYWVEIALLVAMSVFVGSWLRYRKPPVENAN